MTKGHIIFLNGTSSSGKSTIARALQERLPEPYMHFAVDSLLHFYPERILKPTCQEDLVVLRQLIPAVVSGLHRSAAALAEAGNNLIVDHVLEREAWLKECVELWARLDVLFVGVKCPLHVLEQREAERGDRAPGLAKLQYDRVHAHRLYDVEMDTSVLDTDECVTKIMEALDKGHSSGAFSQLRLNSDE